MFKEGKYKKAISIYSTAIAYTSGLPGSQRSKGEADIVKKYAGIAVEPIS